jgi:hypothetical protein
MLEGGLTYLRNLVSANDDNDSCRIGASSSRSTRHLSVLARKKIPEALAVVLASAREDDRSCRHVHTLWIGRKCASK